MIVTGSVARQPALYYEPPVSSRGAKILRQRLGSLHHPPHPPSAPSPPKKPGGEGLSRGGAASACTFALEIDENRDPSPLRRGEKVPKADEGGGANFPDGAANLRAARRISRLVVQSRLARNRISGG